MKIYMMVNYKKLVDKLKYIMTENLLNGKFIKLKYNKKLLFILKGIGKYMGFMLKKI